MSPSTQPVATTLKEVNIPCEAVMVHAMGGENRNPEYLKSMHPFGIVPVLIYESQATVRYSVAKYAPDSNLVPKDLKKNDLFEQAMSVELFNFHPYALVLAAEKFWKKMRGFPTSDETAAECAQNLEGKESWLPTTASLASRNIQLTMQP
ncbi:hypothetical protein ACEPAH_9351 [Sanghuangporus vaninii]